MNVDVKNLDIYSWTGIVKILKQTSQRQMFKF